jgi:hypothetical protein
MKFFILTVLALLFASVMALPQLTEVMITWHDVVPEEAIIQAKNFDNKRSKCTVLSLLKVVFLFWFSI